MSTPGSRTAPPEPPGSRPPAPTRLLLVRHGQSTWNDQRRIQGQLDPPLSELGREQARRLAERLADGAFNGFYTSDLRRARDTASAVAAVTGREAEPRADLREIALGEWEGLTREELIDRYPELWERWQRAPSWDIPPGCEGAAAFEARVALALQRILERHPRGDVLVVTHGGVIQVALARVFGKGSAGVFPFVIDNCSITTLMRGPNRMVIAGVNDTCHLTDGTFGVASRRDRSGGLTGTY